MSRTRVVALVSLVALTGCSSQFAADTTPQTTTVEAPTLPTDACRDTIATAASSGGEDARTALVDALDRCESEPDFLAAVDEHPLAFGTLDADDARAAARVELAAACEIDEHVDTPVCRSVTG